MNTKRAMLSTPSVSGNTAGTTKSENLARRDVSLAQEKIDKFQTKAETVSSVAQAAFKVHEANQKRLDERELEMVEEQVYDLQSQVSAVNNSQDVRAMRKALDDNEKAMSMAERKVGDRAIERKGYGTSVGLESEVGSKDYTLKRKAAIRAQKEEFNKMRLQLNQKEQRILRDEDFARYQVLNEKIGRGIAAGGGTGIMRDIRNRIHMINKSAVLGAKEKERAKADLRQSVTAGISTVILEGNCDSAQAWIAAATPVLDTRQIRNLKKELLQAKKVVGEKDSNYANMALNRWFESGGPPMKLEEAKIVANGIKSPIKQEAFAFLSGAVPSLYQSYWFKDSLQHTDKIKQADIITDRLHGRWLKGNMSATDEKKAQMYEEMYSMIKPITKGIHRRFEQDAGAAYQDLTGQSKEQIIAETNAGYMSGPALSVADKVALSNEGFHQPSRAAKTISELASNNPVGVDKIMHELYGFNPGATFMIENNEVLSGLGADLGKVGRVMNTEAFKDKKKQMGDLKANLPYLDAFHRIRHLGSYEHLQEGAVTFALAEAFTGYSEEQIKDMTPKQFKEIASSVPNRAGQILQASIDDEKKGIGEMEYSVYQNYMLSPHLTDDALLGNLDVTFVKGHSPYVHAMNEDGKWTQFKTEEYVTRFVSGLDLLATSAFSPNEDDFSHKSSLQTYVGREGFRIMDIDEEPPRQLAYFAFDSLGKELDGFAMTVAIHFNNKRRELGFGAGTGYDRITTLKEVKKRLKLPYTKEDEEKDEKLRDLFGQRSLLRHKKDIKGNKIGPR